MFSKILQHLAKVCVNCTLCKAARKNKEGFAYRVVTIIENKICPFCISYKKLYGKKAHE